MICEIKVKQRERGYSVVVTYTDGPAGGQWVTEREVWGPSEKKPTMDLITAIASSLHAGMQFCTWGFDPLFDAKPANEWCRENAS